MLVCCTTVVAYGNPLSAGSAWPDRRGARPHPARHGHLSVGPAALRPRAGFQRGNRHLLYVLSLGLRYLDGFSLASLHSGNCKAFVGTGGILCAFRCELPGSFEIGYNLAETSRVGEIGRRARLRSVYPKGIGFESLARHYFSMRHCGSGSLFGAILPSCFRPFYFRPVPVQ